jgi:DnaJ family protein C protein 3
MSRYIDILSYFFILVSLSDLFIFGAVGDTSADVNEHLEKGKRLLATGQLSDALTHFHAAIGMKKYTVKKTLMDVFMF